MALSPEHRAQLSADIERWSKDPQAFVLEVFAPGWEDAHPGREFRLEKWHEVALAALVKGPRIAAKASKGVGKTAWLSWVGWWFLTCFQHPKGLAASITGDNLKTGLWSELAIWQGYSPLLSALFEHTAEQVRSRQHPTTWFLAKRTFAKEADPNEQNASMAGFHGDNVFILLDEVGDFPVGVWRAAEGIFTDRNANALLAIVGNANNEDGPLGIIWSREAEHWQTIDINGDPDNPDRCTRVDIEEARKEIALHGRDDNVVRINYLGLFPKRGSNKLIGTDDVTAAMLRDAPKRDWQSDPVIFGLDAALYGDDSNVLAKRQGCMSWMKPEWIWRNVSPGQLASMLAKVLIEHKGYGALFIDVTGGWGEAVRLRLEDLGYPNIIAVDFGAPALDDQYSNRRAEMHFLMADWIKKYGCLTDDAQLRVELCAPTYESVTKAGHSVRQIEPKKKIKERLGRSPDKSDALALTFAAPVFKPTLEEGLAPVYGSANSPAAQKFRKDPYAWMRGKAG